VEQRTYKDNKELTVGKQLFFGEQLVDGRVYIFRACGDEIAGEKTPDLHLTARMVRIHNFHLLQLKILFFSSLF
jgi:hypothetical protein